MQMPARLDSRNDRAIARSCSDGDAYVPMRMWKALSRSTAMTGSANRSRGYRKGHGSINFGSVGSILGKLDSAAASDGLRHVHTLLKGTCPGTLSLCVRRKQRDVKSKVGGNSSWTGTICIKYAVVGGGALSIEASVWAFDEAAWAMQSHFDFAGWAMQSQ